MVSLTFAQLLIEILERYRANFGPNDFLLAVGYRKDTAARLFRQAFDAVFQEFGISTRDADGLVPASLRAGGVTELFRRTEDIPLVRCCCRWDNIQSLEHYLQEMGAAEMMGRLNADERVRCRKLARVAHRWLLRAVS